MEIRGDAGAKAVVAKYPERHLPVKIDDDAALFDVDTTADLAKANGLKP